MAPDSGESLLESHCKGSVPGPSYAGTPLHGHFAVLTLLIIQVVQYQTICSSSLSQTQAEAVKTGPL